MVYEQQSHIIVMLTKVFDFIRVMCSQYWPMDCNKPKRYGQIEVTLLTEEPLADFQIRTFKIRKLTEQQILQPISLAPPIADPADSAAKGEPTPVIVEKKTEFQRPVTPSYNKLHSENDQFRIVYQFHYEKWPTHSCPFATSILQFRRRVRIFMKELQQEEKDLGPIIAHCRYGFNLKVLQTIGSNSFSNPFESVFLPSKVTVVVEPVPTWPSTRTWNMQKKTTCTMCSVTPNDYDSSAEA